MEEHSLKNNKIQTYSVLPEAHHQSALHRLFNTGFLHMQMYTLAHNTYLK